MRIEIKNGFFVSRSARGKIQPQVNIRTALPKHDAVTKALGYNKNNAFKYHQIIQNV